jgi:hypothetical protein
MMTMPIKFDTLEYARKLAQAGIPAPQAEAQAEALRDVLSEATVSPGEMGLLRNDMTARMDVLKTELIARMDALKADMSARMDVLRTDVYAQIAALREDVTAQVASLREVNARLTRLSWMTGIALALSGLSLAAQSVLLMKLLS